VNRQPVGLNPYRIVSTVDQGAVMVIQIVVVAAMVAAIATGSLLFGKALRRRRWVLLGLLAPTVVLAGYLLAVNATALVDAAHYARCGAVSDGVVEAGSDAC